MFSTRPISPLVRRPIRAALPSAAALAHRIDALPHSSTHGRLTARALYAVGLTHVATAAIYIALVISSYTGAIIPVDSKVLFVIPTLVALLGVGMVTIGILGSVSAPWMAALVSLPLALTALYVDNTLVSLGMVAMLLVPAAWLCRQLISDADRRERARELEDAI